MGFPKWGAAGAAGARTAGRRGGAELRGHGAADGRGVEGLKGWGQVAEHEWDQQERTGPRMASVVSSSLAELAVGGGELSLISQGITSMEQVLPLPEGTDHGKVTALNLHYNSLTVLERLSLVPSLTSLRLSSNEIARMSGFEALTALTTLDLSCNRIAAVEGLDGLTALETLTLSFNRIRSLKGLRALAAPTARLRALLLPDNAIASLHELRHLEGFPAMEQLVLHQGHLTNPVCAEPSYAAVVAAAVGASLKTLDAQSLVAHLSRMASPPKRPASSSSAHRAAREAGPSPGKTHSAAAVSGAVSELLEVRFYLTQCIY